MNNSIATRRRDWHPADVQAELKKTGWTLRSLSLANGYSANACTQALYRPWPAVQKIIATTLHLAPWRIWPSRYDGDRRPVYRRATAPQRPFKGKRNPSSSAHAHNV